MVVGRPGPFQRMIWTGLWHRCLMRIIEFSLGWHYVSASFRDFTGKPLQDKSQVWPGVKPRPQRCHRVLHTGYRDGRMTVQHEYRNWSIKLGPVCTSTSLVTSRGLCVSTTTLGGLTINASSKSEPIKPLVIHRG